MPANKKRIGRPPKKKPRGRPRKKKVIPRTKQWSDEEIVAALTKCWGIVSEAAQALGCGPQIIHIRKKTTPAIMQAIRDGKRKIAGKIAMNIYEAVNHEDEAVRLETSKWAAKCKFVKDAGFGFQEIKQVQMSNDPKHPLPPAAQVNVISIHDLPLEERKRLYEQAKKVLEQKQQAEAMSLPPPPPETPS